LPCGKRKENSHCALFVKGRKGKKEEEEVSSSNGEKGRGKRPNIIVRPGKDRGKKGTDTREKKKKKTTRLNRHAGKREMTRGGILSPVFGGKKKGGKKKKRLSPPTSSRGNQKEKRRRRVGGGERRSLSVHTENQQTREKGDKKPTLVPRKKGGGWAFKPRKGELQKVEDDQGTNHSKKVKGQKIKHLFRCQKKKEKAPKSPEGGKRETRGFAGRWQKEGDPHYE